MPRDRGKPHCSFGRGRSQHDRFRPEPALTAHKALDQKAGLEQRAKNHPLTLTRRIMFRIGGKAAVLIVNRAHWLAVGRCIGEPAGAHPRGQHIKAVSHRQITVNTFAHHDIRVAAFNDQRVPPHRHDTPVPITREEIPVTESIARDGIGHVVGGDREAFHLQPHRAIAQRRIGVLNNTGFSQRIALYLDGRGHGSLPETNWARRSRRAHSNKPIGPGKAD